METFLRGCRDKEAAMKAMDREPTTLQKAVRYVKTAIANHRALYGSRGTSGATAYSQRQVSIPSREGSPTHDSSPCRAEPKLSNGKDKNNHSLDEQISHLTSLVEKLTTSVQQSLSRNQVRPSSPVSRDLPFEKNFDKSGVTDHIITIRRTSGRSIKLDVIMEGGKPINAIIDTAAMITLINESLIPDNQLAMNELI